MKIDEFVEISNKKHNNKYDYTESNYINIKTKIKIYCRICQKYFYQLPYHHINGCGCQICSKNKKLNTEEFIKLSKLKYNDKYDYTESNYINIKTKIKIYCRICQKYFYQLPYHHINGCGCQICSKNKKLNTEEFIKLSKLKYNDKYEYSLVKYKNMHTKVKIICKKHGTIEQTPMCHLKNQPNCCCKSKKMNTEDFIKKAKDIHNDKYNYSLTEYITSNKKVKIICNYHNYIFEQLPNNHINKKHGCPICGNTKRRLKRIIEISENKFNGNQVIPSFNKNACAFLDEISKEKNIHIQHAMNGGEYYIKDLGYWLDGYDKKNNIVLNNFIKNNIK